jgi:phosphohistidine phosphatase
LQTWEAIAHEIEASPSIDIREALYDAPEGTILACVQDVANSAAVVLCVGHNPGLERFARRMVRTPTDSEERRRCEYLARELATAALAVIDFDAGSWAQIGPARGALSDYITPADLQGG